MNREEKGRVIEEVRGTLGRSSIAIVTHYRGLTVKEMTLLRRKIRDVGAEYRVIKNTLARRAAGGDSFEGLNGILTGPTGLATSHDPVAIAKVLTEFAKTHPKLQVVGGVMEGRALSVEGIQALAKLPSRDVLLGQLVGVLAAPMRGLVTVLAALPGGLVRALDQIRQQKEQAAAA